MFAIGDCSGFLEDTGKPVLPALAQVSSDTLVAHLIKLQSDPNGAKLIGSIFLVLNDQDTPDELIPE